jgi:hypothetical protein
VGLARRTATQTNERDAKGTGLIMGQSLSAASAMGDARCLSSVFPGRLAPGGRLPSLVHGPWSRRRAHSDEASGGRSRGGGCLVCAAAANAWSGRRY